MNTKIGYAKQHFSEVIRSAAREPQVIYNRDRPVAAVIGPEGLAEFLEWRRLRRRVGMADQLAEARRICTDEDYALELPARADRANPMVERTGRAPRRHQRHK